VRAPGHGGIPRHRVLRRDRGDAVPGAERDGEQEREFTQGGWSSSARDDDDDGGTRFTTMRTRFVARFGQRRVRVARNE